MLPTDNKQFSVLLGQRTLTVCSVIGYIRDVLGMVRLGHNALWHQRHGFAQALCHVFGAMDDHSWLHAGSAMAPVGGADDVVGVVDEVFIDEHFWSGRGFVRHRAQPAVIRRCRQRLFALFQNHNVSDYFRSCIFLESPRRQTNRAHQLCLAGQRSTDICRPLVH